MDLTSRAPGRGNLPARARFRSSLGEQSLNGDWSFRLSPSPAAAPEGIEAPDYDDSTWETIPVPSSWPMHGHGHPAYTNVQYPFPVDPPYPPDENPIGDHRLRFDADPGLTDGAVLRFDGVDNAAEVWLNGRSLGSTRGSRLTAEFDVSGVLVESGNVLVVRVAQWSASSYLEDQDMWWLPGIFRDVTLLAAPRQAIRDIVVRADYADRRGTLRVDVDGDLPATVTVPELGVSVAAGERVDLDRVDGWTAETPKLYQAEISTELETVQLRIGFRTVRVVDTKIIINDHPVLLKGVNRHEHHPDLGRVVPRETVAYELRLMKQHNINAIRTSHYPPHPDLLELADELGFYVIDECDLETHGFGFNGWRNNPVDVAEWQPALVERMIKTVHRDKNHPSIFSWSLGNECGTGANLAAMAEAARGIDDSRLIHYEGDRDSSYVDVYSRMYASHEEVHRIGEQTEDPTEDPAADAHRRQLPFLQCEYVHAMGNGPGGISEYHELFEQYDRLCGGFVWEWLEHGIRKRTADGTEYFGYGGDFGEEVHDGNFVCDGLVSADREPRPALLDLKKVYEPVRITVSDDWSQVTLSNRYDYLGLDHLRLDWQAEDADGRYAAGVLSDPVVGPRDEITVALPEEVPAALRAGAVLTISARLADDAPWARQGHEIGWGQAGSPDAAATPLTGSVTPVSEETADGEQVRLGPAFFDPSTGLLSILGGVPVDGPRLNLWRAPTDNDNGLDWGTGSRVADLWQRTRLDKLRGRLVSVAPVAEGDPGLVVITRYAAPSADRYVEVTITWRSDGSRVWADVTLTKRGNWLRSWARIGLDFVLPGALEQVSWAGRGPEQRYPDTGQSARLGYFSATVGELQVPYVRPQENGSRTANRVTLSDGSDRFTVSGDDISFTARPWSQAALAAADHTVDLQPDSSVHLTIDHRQQGIGTASCGPGVLAEYELVPGEMTEADRSFRIVLG